MPDRPTSNPGFYKSRLVPDGPWVPIKVWLEDGDRCPDTGDLLSDQILRGLLGDAPFDPFGPLRDGRTMDFRDFAKKIDRAEYERLMGLGHDDDEPAARPYEGLDFNQMRPVF